VPRLGGVQEQHHRVLCNPHTPQLGQVPSKTYKDDPCSFHATATVSKGMKGLSEREVVSGTCPEEVKMKVKMKVKLKMKMKVNTK